MQYVRMIDKNAMPSEEGIIDYIGQNVADAWREIRRYIDENYDISPETVFGGLNYGWCIRYRKSGKSFCTLYPEKGAFTVLIVLGNKEVEKAFNIIDEFSNDIRLLLQNTDQLHDGRWLWIRIMSIDAIDDIKRLLQIKRKPKK